MNRIAIIGGGPIGMEAALYGACCGCDVHLYERGRLAENVRAWGHVRFFTTWGRNRSPLACRLLVEAGIVLPPDDSTSPGDELVEYVEQLARLPQLRGRVSTHREIGGLTREGCLKSDFINNPRRADFPFRFQVRDAEGVHLHHADVVIDATGVYATPNWMGSGGAPCPGELEYAAEIDYHLPDVTGRELARFANRHTIIVGSGHSAASTLRSIAELMPSAPATRVTWVVRRDVPPHGYPYTLIQEDHSPHRNELHARANELSRHPNVDFRARTVVDSIEQVEGRFRVRLVEAGRGSLVVEADNLVAHAGFRPDPALWRELQVALHPATDAPLKLAEALIAQNRRVGVGLSTGYAEKTPEEEEIAPASPYIDAWHISLNDPELLIQPEPNFYILGIKSYGRDAGFLMQNGFRQVRDVYRLITGDRDLDLYEGVLDLTKS